MRPHQAGQQPSVGFARCGGTARGASREARIWAAVGIANNQFGTVLLGRELFIANGVWDFSERTIAAGPQTKRPPMFASAAFCV